MIYCIGDSHINIFSGIDEYPEQFKEYGILPYFRSFWVSAVLAYNFKDNSIFHTGLKNASKKKILLNLGEIDCRMHVCKQCEKRNLDEVITDIVNKYFIAIKEIERIGHLVYIFGPSVIPLDPKYKKSPNMNIPFFGHYEAIQAIILMFNVELEKRCKENGNYYFDINENLLDNKGNVKAEYYKDKIHLSQKAMPFILEKLRKDKVI